MVQNRVLLISGLVILCLLILGAYGWRNYSSSRGNEMQIAFAEGLELYHGTVSPSDRDDTDDTTSEGDTENPPQQEYMFESDQERLEKSLASFQNTADEYKGTKIGDLALFYTAQCQIEMDNTEEALPILENLIKNSDHRDVRNLARNSASQLMAAEGNLDQAISYLEQVVEEPSDNYPVQFTLMNIALLHEAKGDLDQALTAYRKVTTEFSETSAAAEARKKITSLDPKGEKGTLSSSENPMEGLLPDSGE